MFKFIKNFLSSKSNEELNISNIKKHIVRLFFTKQSKVPPHQVIFFGTEVNSQIYTADQQFREWLEYWMRLGLIPVKDQNGNEYYYPARWITKIETELQDYWI